MEIEGRVALVTGGATGLGRAMVTEFARRGAAGVVINYRSAPDEAQSLAMEVEALGCEALCVQADVRSDDQVRSMIADVDRRFGRLDIVVNNAGVTDWVPLRDLDAMTDELWDRALDVNLKGTFRCARAAAPLLTATGGMIVNLSSVSGILAGPTTSSMAYAASKAAIIHLTRALAVALAPSVRVNAIAPAWADTRWMRDHYGADYEQAVQRAADSFPLRRIAQPRDIALAVVGLVIGGDFVTGQTLAVDGGRTAG